MKSRVCGVAALLMLLVVDGAEAQTDFYNTDAGRPITVEDAYATERYAFELQLAPVRVQRSRGGVYNWGVEPELSYGFLPRTHLEVGVPIAFVEAGSTTQWGMAGVDLSVLHNLNVETRSFPAFGVVVNALLPAGELAPARTYVSTKGIATRTYRWARIHINGSYTIGKQTESSSGSESAGAVDVSRWLAGAAVDRAFPLRSMLVTAEVFARQPLGDADDVEWNAGGGVRYQLSPYFAVDGGIGRRLSGGDPAWFATFGLSRAFGLAWLLPAQ